MEMEMDENERSQSFKINYCTLLLPFSLSLIAAIAPIILFISYYSQLPDEMAGHFQFDGEPDAWYPKDSVVYLMIGLSALIFILCSICLPIIPFKFDCCRKKNFENSSYWLGSRETTSVYLHISAKFALYLSMNLLIFLAIVQGLVIDANINNGGALRIVVMYPVLALFFVIVLILIYRHIKKLKTDNNIVQYS